MWKKFWTNSGDSYTVQDTTNAILKNDTSQYQWVQVNGVPSSGTPYMTTSTTTWPMVGAMKPVYPYAIDEEYILIDWARKRGESFASEMANRIAMWQQIEMMKSLQSGPYPNPNPSWYSTDQLKQWMHKYYYYTQGSQGQTTATQVTYGGVPIAWDKYNPDVT